MEQKAIKTPIYVSEIIFDKSASIPIDADFSLPDYCPDIVKLLKCRAVSRITSRSVNGSAVNIEGCVTVTAVYSDNKKRICAYEYQYPFSKNYETDKDCDNAEIHCKSRCEYLNCRAISGRKIDIHGAIGVSLKVKKRRCTEVISDFDDPMTELKRSKAPAISPIGYNEKYIVLEEEIDVGPGQPNIRSLIRYDAHAVVRETKIITGKVMIKGDVAITLLYCPEEGDAQSIKSTVPFSQLLEIDGINEDCECECRAELAFIDIKPRFSGDGEEKSFRMNAKLLLCCEGYCNNEVDVVCDAFARKYETDITRCDVDFDRVVKTVNENFSCKKNLDFTENSLCEIIDMWCEAETRNISTENGALNVMGCLTACIIAADAEEVPCYYEKNVDFEYTLQLEKTDNPIHCEPKISVVSCGYTLNNSSSMELRADLGVSAAVYEYCKMPLITDIKIDTKNPILHCAAGAMTICFACGGETVWDIAGKYHASVNEIIKINELEDETLRESQMLLIPS